MAFQYRTQMNKVILQRTDPRLTYLGSGRHRDVYKYKNCVIKFPTDNYSACINIREYNVFLYFTKNKKNLAGDYARCRLLNGDILIMEYLPKIDIAWKDLPSWCKCIDCCQVGFSRSGKLKAYDYGD